ncbi:hypothetical protein [Deinococcus metallilatus]|uniref:Tetratricopeptide repeat protein n=1 Tax=Deinococcus metallilatus TaxID=1211322 RepID=A0ABR6MXA1_9DEIO|nr:hypothetical protein [Deinococcus metallilatus]MBB5296570.1 hypothetical protein [Deinococcus metallilatus]GMA17487.1 hypothetical protein GCM10025871_38180 [Deinococcus metallilatus]
MTLASVRAALERGDDPAALGALRALTPSLDERDGAAALALHLGQPGLTVCWASDPLTLAAAHLRLGKPGQALAALHGQPDAARPALLRARAGWQARQADAPELARHARTLARAEGDAGALVAAATLLGELLLPGDSKAALRTLAEGLKVAELGGQEADAHLLAVLAHAQAPLGSPDKAGRTAAKALSRSLPRSPARVVALLALGRAEEARAEAAAGELGEVWWQPWTST